MCFLPQPAAPPALCHQSTRRGREPQAPGVAGRFLGRRRCGPRPHWKLPGDTFPPESRAPSMLPRGQGDGPGVGGAASRVSCATSTGALHSSGWETASSACATAACPAGGFKAQADKRSSVEARVNAFFLRPSTLERQEDSMTLAATAGRRGLLSPLI